jgi:hypothetical protein
MRVRAEVLKTVSAEKWMKYGAITGMRRELREVV